MKCHKAQVVTKYSGDGTTVYTKCINLASSHFREEVTEEICSSCPLKQLGPCSQNCNKKRRPGLKFSEPLLEGDYLIYKEEDAPIPDGYEKTEKGFKSLWPNCPGLITNNTIHEDGSLKIVVKCGLKKTDTSYEECIKCFEEAAKEASQKVPEKDSKEVEAPPLQTQVKHYAKALYNWVKEGREVRTDEEIQQLLEICKQCDLYDAKKQICKKCGCRVNSGSRAISNKLKMKSESCPLGKW